MEKGQTPEMSLEVRIWATHLQGCCEVCLWGFESWRPLCEGSLGPCPPLELGLSVLKENRAGPLSKEQGHPCWGLRRATLSAPIPGGCPEQAEPALCTRRPWRSPCLPGPQQQTLWSLESCFPHLVQIPLQKLMKLEIAKNHSQSKVPKEPF